MNNTDDIEALYDKRWIVNRVKFSILLTLQIPAFLLSLLIFYFILTNRGVFQTPQNRALLVLFVVNFIQITVLVTFSIHFYAVGTVTPATPIYCTLWTFLGYILYAISGYLMATISVQQHILVFNGHILRIRWKRFLFHYLPLIFFVIYPIIFYSLIILLYPCDGTQWDYTSTICGFTNCYLLYDKVLGTSDWMLNVAFPIVIIVLANVFLIVRVVRQKCRQQRRFRWKRQWRMTVQLLYISSIYIIGSGPSLVVGIAQIFGYPTFLAEIQTTYFAELASLICLLLPWICLGLVPELGRWITTKFRIAPAHNIVAPIEHAPHLMTQRRINDTHNNPL